MLSQRCLPLKPGPMNRAYFIANTSIDLGSSISTKASTAAWSIYHDCDVGTHQDRAAGSKQVLPPANFDKHPYPFQIRGLIMADNIANKVSEERQRWTARDSRSPIENGMDILRLLEYPQLLDKTYLDHAGTTVRHVIALYVCSCVTDKHCCYRYGQSPSQPSSHSS